ncbi:MAG: hypothetical protein IT276_01335 [Ignavibacteriaceae bacterium]|nr:hypothetical protein [Ignavibacterium sp.]MCC6253535.1 hypothetical protein [Ignavibacteriaceae bacterium]HRN25462.1 hypothetical protein [Ignavibacteriaceae bacterium]HRP91277.1 hypothetical protein [Ignavibacteriaceae bacterium]HRQ52713.1 hypothetical protein [Ignavibacteriaceae bacterium]
MRTKNFYFAGKYFSTFRKSLGIISIALLFLFIVSCDVNNAEDTPLTPLPDDAAVYLSMDGTEAGLWILNANTFELIDSIITAPGVPWYIEFSPDNTIWYSCWGRGSDYKLFSVTLKPMSVNNSISLQNANSSLVYSKNKDHLIAYNNKGIEIFERTSLNLIKCDSSTIFGESSRITPSRINNAVYFTWIENRQIVGFGKYDLTSLKVIDTLRLFNDTQFYGLQDVDLTISNDDKYLFFSAFNWRGLSGFGSFFVIDLTQRTILKEYRVGAFSQLAISPDGKNVFISDPGGYLYNFPSSGKIWKYNVENKTMNVLLNELYFTDRITVAEDNRTLFITPVISFSMKDGQRAWVVKVDAQNGQFKNYYPVFYDSTGYYTNNPRNIRMGQYIK